MDCMNPPALFNTSRIKSDQI